MSSPNTVYWTPTRIALWAGALAVLSLWQGPKFIEHFRPRENQFYDFSQEWLSAKNYWAGTPVYANQTEALLRHTGYTPDRAADMLPWNAHPPVVTTLTLPFGKLSYPDALLVWNLLTFPLFLITVWVVLRELGALQSAWSLLPLAVLFLLFSPIYHQVAQGQLNGLLGFLIALAWVADRRGRPGWAGVAVGLAAGLKLFPAFLFAYFLFAGRRALVTGGLTVLVVNGLAFAVLGPGEFRTYVREVIPSLSGYQSSWFNVSLTGFWLRIFNPQAREKVIPLVVNPLAGAVLVWVSQVIVTALVVWAAWAARSARSVEARDRAFAAAVVGMVLVSPIAWTHYFVLLVLPLALVWLRMPSGFRRWVMTAAFVIIWLPGQYLIVLAMGQAQALARVQHLPQAAPLPPGTNLAVMSAPTYALLALFLLVLLLPVGTGKPDPEPEPEAEPGDEALVPADPPPAAPHESDDELLNRRLFGPVGESTGPPVESPTRGK
jgi:hypothetical protein